MALDSFSNLKTAMGNFLNRDDLTSAIPDFITLAEASIDRDLRHWKMITTDEAFTIDSRYEDLPADFLEAVQLSIPDQKIDILSQHKMATYRARDNANDRPRYYCFNGDRIEVYPTPSTAETAILSYYQSVPALSDENISNWLLVRAPDVYLYGALIHSAPYLVEDPRIPVWRSFYESAVDALNRKSRAAQQSGAGLAIR